MPGRDAGLQPERTRLAWRRTTLACTVAAVLALRQTVRGTGSPVEVAGATAVAAVWLVFLWVARRRMRALRAARPPGLAPRAAVAVAVCAGALAALAVVLIV
ncbi:DUF202 domain-containing protein [Streptomyces sp. NPDC051567]|uniref:DUF202 domain-containing protein n=1 Tax=Streptomyces sp. NPDC051567 TaxID=3365660 RepID=UPI003796772A